MFANVRAYCTPYRCLCSLWRQMLALQQRAPPRTIGLVRRRPATLPIFHETTSLPNSRERKFGIRTTHMRHMLSAACAVTAAMPWCAHPPRIAAPITWSAGPNDYPIPTARIVEPPRCCLPAGIHVSVCHLSDACHLTTLDCHYAFGCSVASFTAQ